MDLELGRREQELRERARRLSAQVRAELAGSPDDAFPHGPYRALAEAGLLGAALPERFGGGGGGLADAVLLVETLAERAPELVSPGVVNLACGALILAAGSAAQHERWLPGLVAGRLRFAFALTEPDAGSDAAALSTRAEASGEAHLLTGTKLYTTGAADCDFVLTVARTRPEAPASQGCGVFAVPSDAAGLRIDPLHKIAGNQHASCRVRYEAVQVASEYRLGDEARAWSALRLTAGIERLLMAAASLGAAQAVLDEARDFARERVQFGQPIAGFQAVQHRLADMATEIEAMRWLTYRAAWRADHEGAAAAPTVCMAKLFCTERLQQIVLDGMKLLGGRAYLSETPMARRHAEALLGLYAGGTNEIQRNLIARDLLRDAG